MSIATIYMYHWPIYIVVNIVDTYSTRNQMSYNLLPYKDLLSYWNKILLYIVYMGKFGLGIDNISVHIFCLMLIDNHVGIISICWHLLGCRMCSFWVCMSLTLSCILICILYIGLLRDYIQDMVLDSSKYHLLHCKV